MQSTIRYRLLLTLSLLLAVGVHGQSPDDVTRSRSTSPEQIADVSAAPQHTGTFEQRRAVPPKYDIDRIGDRGIGAGINIYSVEKEQKLGRKLADLVDQNSRVFEDRSVTEYVDKLTQKIVRHSDAKVPFTVKVLDNDEINAFSLPGGYLYVNSGLIVAAESEAELAGVIAHEVSHVAARHGTKNETRGLFWNLASIPLVFVGGPAGGAVRQVAGIAGPMSVLRFSRKAELEADLLGIEYMYSAGYDPSCLVKFFERVNAGQNLPRSRLAKAFSTHPVTSDRITASQKIISYYLPDRDSYVVSTSEFDLIRERISSQQVQRRLGKRLDGPVLRRRVDQPGSTIDNSDTPHESESHKH